MEKRSRLGRGLSSLLNPGGADEHSTALPIHIDVTERGNPSLADTVVTAPGTPEMLHVELSRIQANPTQPRKHFDQASLASLAESVRVAGIIQPIIVRQAGDYFEVIAGERRWRAAKLAGLQTIPVIIRRAEPAEQAQLALIENIHRQDLNPIERANAYREMVLKLNLTQAELASRLGEDRSSVGHYLRLLDLPATTQKLIVEGTLSLGHAKLLTSLADHHEVERLAHLAVSQSLSVRALEALLKQGAAVATPPAPDKTVTPHIVDLERRISRDLSMRAEVKQAKNGGRGRLVLHYASLDQFDELLARLGIKVDD
jgi:ParB family chromosome partitioning protein